MPYRWVVNWLKRLKMTKIRTICSDFRQKISSESRTIGRSNVQISDVLASLDHFIYIIFLFMTPFIYKTVLPSMSKIRTNCPSLNNRNPNDQLFERSIVRLWALSEIRTFGFRMLTVFTLFQIVNFVGSNSLKLRKLKNLLKDLPVKVSTQKCQFDL